jgi:hypothetical protein
MKKPLLLAAALIFGLAPYAIASTRVGLHNQLSVADAIAPVADKLSGADGHPLAQPIASQEVRIDITSDSIFRSCCKPPDLLVSGKVTNLTSRPINYVRLVINMKDAQGRQVYSEDTYNHGAITLFEDPQIAKLLNEKRHFDPLAPGASDTFVFVIPMPLIPRYKSVAIAAGDVVHSPAMAQSH